MGIIESLSVENFIRLHIEERDRVNFSDEEVAAHVRGLEKIVAEVGIPENLTGDEWLHSVASPRINNEALSPWMEEFQAWLWDEVDGLNTVEKILRVNELAAAEVTYQSSNARTLPPPALKRGIYGRCGEESTFVTAALRSVGIPARQVYAPLWNHSDDNHAWVEAFDGESWRFLGACEPEAVLDIGWFNAAAARAPLVVSRTHIARADSSPDDLGVNRAGQHLKNESQRYRDGACLKFSVSTEEDGFLSIYLLNYSSLAPLLEVAVKNLNEHELDLGAGTYHLSYETKSGRYGANLDLVSLEDQTIELKAESWDMSLENLPTVWHAAAVSRPVPEVSDEDRAKGLAIRAEATRRRQDKEDSQKQYALELAKGRSDLEGEILERSRGNSEEVSKLLDLASGNEAVLQLLLLVPQKDLYELKAEEYFGELKVVLDAANELDPKLRVETLLNPRIHTEDFSIYRSGLKIEPKTPDQIMGEMREQYEFNSQNMEPYEPLTVLAKQPKLSLRDFTKLLCGNLRAHGHPVQYINEGLVKVFAGEWRMLAVEEPSRLRLISQDQDYAWRSGQNYQLINLDHDPVTVRTGLGVWTGSSELIYLIGRKYGVMTTIRLPNGDQRSQITMVEVVPGEVTEIELSLPPVSAEDLLVDLPIPSEALVQALNLPDTEVGLAVLAQGGHEPSEHAFEELTLLWDGLSSRLDKVTIYYDSSREGTLEALERSPRFLALLEEGLVAELKPLDYSAHLESLGRGLFVEPETLPLIMLYETRDSIARIRYSHAGYIVGLGERILNSIEEI